MAAAFTRAVDRIIAIAPDIVLIGGDVFHTVRPTNTAILHAFRQFSRLVAALPRAHVIVVAGNHDMPRSTETMCILRLFEQGFVARDAGGATEEVAAPLPILVADREPRRLSFPHLGLSVLAVPDLPVGTVDLSPDPTSRFNVLLLHGEVKGVLPNSDDADRAAMQIPVEELSRPGWDYRGARPLPRLQEGRRPRLLLGLARVHEHQPVGRARRGARGEAPRQGDDRARPRDREADLPSAAAIAAGDGPPARSRGGGCRPRTSTRRSSRRSRA